MHKISYLICTFIIITNSTYLFAQTEFVPFLLKSGKKTYVKKGTNIPVIDTTFDDASLFDKNGFAIVCNYPSLLTEDSSQPLIVKKYYGLLSNELEFKFVDSLITNKQSKLNSNFEEIPLKRLYSDWKEDWIVGKSDTIFYTYISSQSNNQFLSGIINNEGRIIYRPKGINSFDVMKDGRIIGNNIYREAFVKRKNKDSISVSRILENNVNFSEHIINNVLYNQMKYGIALLDYSGKVIMPLIPPYNFSSNSYKYNIIPYELSSKCGYLDKDGIPIVFAKYDKCKLFWQDFAETVKDGSIYYINSNGEENTIVKNQKKINLKNYFRSLIGSENFKLYYIHKNTFIGESSGYYSFIRKYGRHIDLPDEDYLVLTSENEKDRGIVLYDNFTETQKNEKIIILDQNLNVISNILLPISKNDNSYWRVDRFFVNTLCFTNSHNTILYNFRSNKIIENCNDEFRKGPSDFFYVSEGYYPFKNKSSKWGYKNENGEIVIQPYYSECKSFVYGHALVKDYNGWSIINNKGKSILKLGNKYNSYILEIVAPDLISCTWGSGINAFNSAKSLPLLGENMRAFDLNIFYIDLNGFEYRENDQ